MPTHVQTIITMREYDFTELRTNASSEVIVYRALALEVGEEVEFCVRVHAATVSSGHSIKLIARPVSITEDEPEVDYLGDDVATATINNQTDDEEMIVREFTPPFGTAVQIVVKGQKNSQQNTLKATISVDLVQRD